jgi:hypothetical protein
VRPLGESASARLQIDLLPKFLPLAFFTGNPHHPRNIGAERETALLNCSRRPSTIHTALGVLLLLLAAAQPALPVKPKSIRVNWIQMEGDRLVYGKDGFGNRIPDFSTAGYGGGGVSIPDVPVRATLDPVAAGAPTGDDTPRIQAAIGDLAHQPPDADGFRGALLLHPGVYQIAGTILVNASGIVLRGSGTDASGTNLIATGGPHTVIRVGGTGTWQPAGTKHPVIDTYIPIGADTITVDDASDLQIGDQVILEWSMTKDWIHTVGMDHIPPRRDGREIYQWQPGPALHFDRRILAIDGNRVKLDAALTNTMARGENTVLYRYSFPGRIAQSGIENLRSDGSAFEKAKNFSNPENLQGEHPHFVGGGYFDSVFAAFDSVENAWMRNVALTHYSDLAKIDAYARAVTIEDVNADHVGTVATHAPAQAFSIHGQQTLVQHCHITGGYSHAWATQSHVAGPNVFRYCTARGTRMDAGPHQRWGTGTLYEDLKIDGTIAIGNRSNKGTGHGWAGANNVIWNSETASYQVASPFLDYNWAFGTKGSIVNEGAGNPPGIIISPGKHIRPESLYEQQLRERLAGNERLAGK